MANDASSPPQVDLNEANLETLKSLPGIGRKLAERIIEFRKEVHPFDEAIEITAVPGISERMYRQFADKVTVSLSGEARGVEEPVEFPPSPEDSISKTEVEEYVITTDQVEEVKPLVEQPDADKQGAADGAGGVTYASIGGVPPPSPPPHARDETEDFIGEGHYIIQADMAEREGEIPKIEAIPKETDKIGEPSKHSPVEPEPEEGYIISPELDEGSSFWRPWLLMVVGALAGACLALLLMYSLSDWILVLENHPKITELEDEIAALEKQEAALNKEIQAMQEQLEQFDALSARLQNTEAEIQILKQARDALTGQVATLENETSEIADRLATLEKQQTTLNKQVETLEEASEQMQEDIEALQLDTGRFDDFLTKLRDLLLAVQGAPDSPPTSTTSTPTKKATSTPRPSPTRTPTPTSTPAS